MQETYVLDAAVPDDGTVVEVGCSIGTTTEELVEQYPDATVLGVDVANNFAGADRYLQGGASALPLQDDAADVVCPGVVRDDPSVVVGTEEVLVGPDDGRLDVDRFAGVLVGLAWQLPFLLYALAIPVAAVVYRWFEEPVDVDGDSPDQGGGEPYRRALARLLARPRVAAIVVARSLPVVVWLGFFTYNSLIVARVFGGSALEAGVLAAAGNFVFAIAGSQAGRLSARLGSRFVPLGLANGCLTAGFAAVLFAPDLRVAVAGIAVAGLGFGLSLTLYRSLLTRMATPALRGGVVSLSAAGGRLTATLTPVAMGAAIAWLEPAVGLTAALRTAGLGAAVVGGGGGFLATVAAWLAPAVAQPSAFAIE
jgi:hypothetical protein